MFITDLDFDGTVHREILSALTRDDNTLPMICADRAIAEARGYLESRYDCDTIFSASGADRNPLVLMMVLDITIYHIFCIHNPQKLSQMRKDRYDRAITWLKGVGREDINISGAPLIAAESRKSKYYWASRPKRNNYM